MISKQLFNLTSVRWTYLLNYLEKNTKARLTATTNWGTHSMNYHSLGITQHELGDFKAALQAKQRALDIRIKLFAGEHQSTTYCYYELGNIQHKIGDFKVAL